jgi:hypothetical protein
MKGSIPWLLALLLLAGGLHELREYNITWDEALGDYFFGERYLSYLTTFDARYLDFRADPYPPDHVPDLRRSMRRLIPWEYWPVANIMAAATSRVLSNGLHLLDPFDGFHALNVLLGAVLLVVLYRFVERRASTAAAILTVSLLFLMPRLAGDFFANIKDYPELVFFTLTLLAFFAAYERGSPRGIAASGALWGLALGTKANAAFIAPIVILYISARGFGEPWRARKRTLLLALLGAGLIAGAIVFASWPYLWQSPVTRLLENYDYISGRAFDQQTRNAPWWQMLLLTTPPVVLLLIAAALPLFVAKARRREPLAILLLVWTAVVAARLSLPGALNFDGVRHFLELFPPLVMMAAIGAVELAQRFVRSAAVRATVLAVPVVLTAVALVVVHPFELVYWNVLGGGYAAARAANRPQASDYWATSYRQGMRWINRNAPSNTLLVVTVSPHTVAMAAPLRLRRDIGVASVSRERAERFAQTRPVYVMFVPREEWRTPLDRELERTAKPVAMWERDGAPVLLIYRLRTRE